MSQIRTFRQVIQLWPSVVEMANDVGVPPFAPKQWKYRDRIPAEFWLDVVEAAAARGITGVTYELLARLISEQYKATDRTHGRQRKPPRRKKPAKVVKLAPAPGYLPGTWRQRPLVHDRED